MIASGGALRILLALSAATLVAACSPIAQAPEPTPLPDPMACRDASEHIDADVKVRQSPQLKIVEELACYYGERSTVTKASCSIPLDVEEIGGRDGDDTYGLRNGSVAALISAATYGDELGHQTLMYRITRGLGEKDTDDCLQGIQDLPHSFETLVRAIRNLRNYGY